jgi:hypothetical protein
MKHMLFALCVLFAGFAATAEAQVQGQAQAPAPAPASGSFSIKCSPNLVSYAFSQTQTVWTYACTTDAAVNGVPFGGLTFSATNQRVTGGSVIWGVIVGTLTNGDRVFFQFHTDAKAVNGVDTAGETTYKIVGGTGIANGIAGSGTCKGSGAPGQGSEMACAGGYTVR